MFEPPRPKREIPQCANCQRYGHTKRFCYRSLRCVKCAGNHATTACLRKEWSDFVKCVLCSGNHPANYKGCMVYKDLQKTKYPAPRPRIQTNNQEDKHPKINRQGSQHLMTKNIVHPKTSYVEPNVTF